MPSLIYLQSGDEFTVSAPYAVVLADWTAARGSARSFPGEYTALWWTSSEEASSTTVWPLYRESVVTIDLAHAVAVERLDDAHAALIAQAQAAEAERAE